MILKNACLQSRFSILTIIRNIKLSHTTSRRSPDFRSRFRNRPFPFFKLFYDKDLEGPLDVVIDRLDNHPPGKWGSMDCETAWKMYELSKKYQKFGTVMEKYREMSWDEYNLFYHDLKLPLLFPETLDFAQFITRTKVVHDIPDTVKEGFNDVFSEDLLKMTMMLQMQIDTFRQKNFPFIYEHESERKHELIELLIHQIMQTIVRSIVSYKFLNTHAYSSTSKIETFFKRAGYDNLDVQKHIKDHDGFVKYKMIGELAWNLRSKNPLKPFISVDDVSLFNNGDAFPIYNYHPELFDLESDDNIEFRCQPYQSRGPYSKYINNCPGFWGPTIFKPGDPCAFGILGVINTSRSRSLIDDYNSYTSPVSIVDRHIVAEAVMSGFTWTVAQAQNQGFMIYDDLHYPFCSSLLITDGKNVQIAYYQLNSLTGLWKPEDANEPVNIIWMGPKMELFDEDGKDVMSINQIFLQQLVAAIFMPTIDMDTNVLQPYLSESEDQVSRDRTRWLIDFDPTTATERAVQEHKIKVDIKDQPRSWRKPHPNRIWFFRGVTNWDMQDELKKIVPKADGLPQWYTDSIKERRRKIENRRKGKPRFVRDPPEHK